MDHLCRAKKTICLKVGAFTCLQKVDSDSEGRFEIINTHICMVKHELFSSMSALYSFEFHEEVLFYSCITVVQIACKIFINVICLLVQLISRH